MADKKIITVLGSTGAQGGGLARAILADKSGEFTVRAFTRHPDSEKAQALAKAGAEVVQGDFDDEDSLRHAFEGAHGAFCMTNYWEHFSGDKELAQAKHMAKAAKEARLQHVIWSTLEDVRTFYPLDDPRMPTIDGKWKVPHFDAKGEADRFFVESGVPTTFLMASFYWENFIFFGLARRRTSTLGVSDGHQETGGHRRRGHREGRLRDFKAGDQYVGKKVGIYGEALTIEEMGKKLSSAIGLPSVYYHAAEADEYRGYGFPGADEMGNMFEVPPGLR